MASTLGVQNPFRYRGYYYDIESGYYYLNSRYYDPVTGRFLNGDSLLNQESVLGNNIFSYCLNNPVNMADTSGNFPFLILTALVCATIGGIIGGVTAANNNEDVVKGTLVGMATGALIGAGVGAIGGAALAGSALATTGQVVAGANFLAATVTTSGIGAGASLIANNLSQTINNTAPVIQTGTAKMQEVTAKGKAGELASGLVKNTEHIPSYTGTATYRIPDALTDTFLAEVKNYSGTLSYTNQLKDFVLYSQDKGLDMFLYTNAPLSGPLQQVVDSGLIKLIPLY